MTNGSPPPLTSKAQYIYNLLKEGKTIQVNPTGNKIKIYDNQGREIDERVYHRPELSASGYRNPYEIYSEAQAQIKYEQGDTSQLSYLQQRYEELRRRKGSYSADIKKLGGTYEKATQTLAEREKLLQEGKSQQVYGKGLFGLAGGGFATVGGKEVTGAGVTGVKTGEGQLKTATQTVRVYAGTGPEAPQQQTKMGAEIVGTIGGTGVSAGFMGLYEKRKAEIEAYPQYEMAQASGLLYTPALMTPTGVRKIVVERPIRKTDVPYSEALGMSLLSVEQEKEIREVSARQEAQFMEGVYGTRALFKISSVVGKVSSVVLPKRQREKIAPSLQFLEKPYAPYPAGAIVQPKIEKYIYQPLEKYQAFGEKAGGLIGLQAQAIGYVGKKTLGTTPLTTTAKTVGLIAGFEVAGALLPQVASIPAVARVIVRPKVLKVINIGAKILKSPAPEIAFAGYGTAKRYVTGETVGVTGRKLTPYEVIAQESLIPALFYGYRTAPEISGFVKQKVAYAKTSPLDVFASTRAVKVAKAIKGIESEKYSPIDFSDIQRLAPVKEKAITLFKETPEAVAFGSGTIKGQIASKSFKQVTGRELPQDIDVLVAQQEKFGIKAGELLGKGYKYSPEQKIIIETKSGETAIDIKQLFGKKGVVTEEEGVISPFQPFKYLDVFGGKGELLQVKLYQQTGGYLESLAKLRPQQQLKFKLGELRFGETKTISPKTLKVYEAKPPEKRIEKDVVGAVQLSELLLKKGLAETKNPLKLLRYKRGMKALQELKEVPYIKDILKTKGYEKIDIGTPEVKKISPSDIVKSISPSKMGYQFISSEQKPKPSEMQMPSPIKPVSPIKSPIKQVSPIKSASIKSVSSIIKSPSVSKAGSYSFKSPSKIKSLFNSPSVKSVSSIIKSPSPSVISSIKPSPSPYKISPSPKSSPYKISPYPSPSPYKISPSPSPSPYKSTPLSPLFKPFKAMEGGLGVDLGTGLKGAKKGYAPSLLAVTLGIKGGRRDVTGVGIRPILSVSTKAQKKAEKKRLKSLGLSPSKSAKLFSRRKLF